MLCLLIIVVVNANIVVQQYVRCKRHVMCANFIVLLVVVLKDRWPIIIFTLYLHVDFTGCQFLTTKVYTFLCHIFLRGFLKVISDHIITPRVYHISTILLWLDRVNTSLEDEGIIVLNQSIYPLQNGFQILSLEIHTF